MSTKILVDGEGLAEVEVVEVPLGGSLKDVVVRIAEKAGANHEEFAIFIEDEGEPLDVTILVHEHAHQRKVHHVHRCKEIKVTVNYQAVPEHHRFPPATRIEKVLHWAVKKFKIDPTIAPEMALALTGTVNELPGGAHIGRYAKHDHCSVELDLIRGDIHQGRN